MYSINHCEQRNDLRLLGFFSTPRTNSYVTNFEFSKSHYYKYCSQWLIEPDPQFHDLRNYPKHADFLTKLGHI